MGRSTLAFSLFILILSIGCTNTKSSIKSFVDPSFNPSIFYKVISMPISEEHLKVEEMHEINEEIAESLTDGLVTVFEYQKIANQANVHSDLLIDWKRFWEKYLKDGTIDKQFLKHIGEKFNVNAVMQGKVLDVKKKFARHRKQIGEATAEVKFSLFSTKTGKLLWEAHSSGTMINAHSDQGTPYSIEAIEIALDKIFDDFPLRKY